MPPFTPRIILYFFFFFFKWKINNLLYECSNFRKPSKRFKRSNKEKRRKFPSHPKCLRGPQQPGFITRAIISIMERVHASSSTRIVPLFRVDSGLKIELGHPRKSKRGRGARFRAADYEIRQGSLPEDKGGPNGPRETGKGGKGRKGGGRKIRAPRTEAMVFEGRANGPLIDRKEKDVKRRRRRTPVLCPLLFYYSNLCLSRIFFNSRKFCKDKSNSSNSLILI